MPRKIKNLIYYERKRISAFSWAIRACRKSLGIKKASGLPSRLRFVSRALPIYDKTLAFERKRYLADFDRELRKNTDKNVFTSVYRSAQKIVLSEKTDLFKREEAAKYFYKQHLKKSKHG